MTLVKALVKLRGFGSRVKEHPNSTPPPWLSSRSYRLRCDLSTYTKAPTMRTETVQKNLGNGSSARSPRGKGELVEH